MAKTPLHLLQWHERHATSRGRGGMTDLWHRIRAQFLELISLPKPFRAADWNNVAKRTVARFARGNIAAQQGRILFPDEQAEEHKRARRISLRWQEPKNTRSAD
jgi:hypothetical protein